MAYSAWCIHFTLRLSETDSLRWRLLMIWDMFWGNQNKHQLVPKDISTIAIRIWSIASRELFPFLVAAKHQHWFVFKGMNVTLIWGWFRQELVHRYHRRQSICQHSEALLAMWWSCFGLSTHLGHAADVDVALSFQNLKWLWQCNLTDVWCGSYTYPHGDCRKSWETCPF